MPLPTSLNQPPYIPGTGKARPPLEQALKALRALKPLSVVATHLLQLVTNEDIAFRKIADLIRADAPLSADTLRIANSALFGPRFPVTGILHAVAMLGLDRVRSLVTTVALKNLAGPALGTPAFARCWRHNLACAFICDELARQTDINPDYAYTAGLLHDIGRLAMMSVWRKPYAGLLDAAKPDSLALLQLERQEFGIAHTLAGFTLLNDWKLPVIFAEIADRHHHPPLEGMANIMIVVHFSCLLADTLGFSVVSQPAVEESETEVLLQPAIRKLISGSLADLGFRVADRINTLECCLAGA
jgi:putative nucleotidyltransferase with HDIG domain